MTTLHQQVSDETPIQVPFAIAKLEEATRIIRQSTNELPAMRRRLEKNKQTKFKARDIYRDIQNQHQRLLGAFVTAALSLLEAEQDELAAYTMNLRQSIESFNLMTPDYSKLYEALNGFLSRLPIVDPLEASNTLEAVTDSGNTESSTTNSHIIGRLMNHVRMGYYPTCKDNLAHIVRGLDFSEGISLNLLDPCCGCGIALRSLADGISGHGIDSKTYGIELDTYRAEEALTRLDRVGFGSYFHSRISNEAFHAMLLNPPYMSVITQGGSKNRSEKSFLIDSIINLMMGGLLIYIIPYYRLTADIARILCDNFSDITVWKFSDREFKKFKQIAILGTRHKRIDSSNIARDLTALVLDPDALPQLTDLPTGCYQLPNIPKEVSSFKGAMFNEAELANQLSSSKSFSRLFQRSKLDNVGKRPLLPLNLSQIGLVGGSGLINGLVECDTPHIIKGRIVKEKRIHTEDNENTRGDLMSTTLTEVVSNKLVFNLLTPNGFISLTEYGNSGAIVDSDGNIGDNDMDTDNKYINNGDSDVRNSDGDMDTDNDNKPPPASLRHTNPHTSDKSPKSDGSASADDMHNNSTILPLGRTVITRAAREALSDYDINASLSRHQSGDWGNVSEGDRKRNDRAVKDGDRVLSVYYSDNGERLWIITEWDRSVTTVLLPDDY